MKKLFVLSATFLLAACGGDGVDKGELREAINNMGSRFCVPFQLNVSERLPNENSQHTVFGAKEVKLLKRMENGKRANEHASKQMEALVRAGLYKADKEQRVGEGDKAVRYAIYSLTERGENEIKRIANQNLLCIGKVKAHKIKYFTEPTANAKGVIVTNVSYEAKLQPEKWANSLIKESEHGPFLQDGDVRMVTLMKTSEGWRDVHELLLKNVK